MRRSAGFVLLNALIVVIAIAAIATAVLRISARATARAWDMQADAQLALYLDGAEALIVTFLEQEWEKGGTDHLGELWARETLQVPIDRGRIGATLSDMQGRLNLNRLPQGGRPRDEIARLFQALALPQALLEALERYLAEAGPPDAAPYLGRDMPVQPRGGPARLMDELRLVEGMTEAAFDTLAPFVTVLPRAVPVNVNTAPAEVLAAILPDLSADEIAGILRDRQDDPFASGRDFLIRMAQRLGEEALAGLPADRFAGQSSHFDALILAELEGRRLQRRVIVFRDETQGGRTHIRYALPVPPRVQIAPPP